MFRDAIDRPVNGAANSQPGTMVAAIGPGEKRDSYGRRRLRRTLCNRPLAVVLLVAGIARSEPRTDDGSERRAPPNRSAAGESTSADGRGNSGGVTEGPPAPVRVSFSASEAEQIGIQLYRVDGKGKADEPLIRCETPCAPALEKGRYRVVLGDEWGGGSTVLAVSRSASFRVERRDPTAAYWGLGLGIAGPLVFLGGGFALILMNAGYEKCGENCTSASASPAGEALGIGMIVTGVALTVVGWILFGKNVKPKVTPVSQTSSATAHPSLAVFPLRTGFSSGTGFIF